MIDDKTVEMRDKINKWLKIQDITELDTIISKRKQELDEIDLTIKKREKQLKIIEKEIGNTLDIKLDEDYYDD